jgi:hypothetical protein
MAASTASWHGCIAYQATGEHAQLEDGIIKPAYSLNPLRVDAFELGPLHECIDLLVRLREVREHLGGFRGLLGGGGGGARCLRLRRGREDRQPELAQELVCCRLACGHLPEERLWDVVCGEGQSYALLRGRCGAYFFGT